MTVRQRTEEQERRVLSAQAALACESAGRRIPEEACTLRTAYQRDRDRILHCKSFRRLKHKTQMFLSPEGDHYRTRLTHTLEVSQIARTIARALQLNEDLTEAISLGHDLGHTPFGHAGERALDALAPDGFRHYEQSVRVVEILENGGRGLNLTREVCDGILCHTRGREAATMEGRVVRLADRIAYVNHDIDDAERAGVLRHGDIPAEAVRLLGARRSERIDTLVHSVVENSCEGALRMAPDIERVFRELHEFMFATVYTHPYAKAEERKVPELIGWLYGYFMQRPEELPEEMQQIAAREGAARAVCDYIAGMTDQYAIQLFESLFVPRSWH
jgi:dGTPase